MPNAHPAKSPLIASILVFLISMAVAMALSHQSEHNRQLNERARAKAVAADHGQHLQQNLLHALSATHALAAWVQLGNGQIANFDALAKGILPLYPGVSAVALEPQGVVQHIIPQESNDNAIGLDLFNHPDRKKEAALARDSGQLTLAGPFKLVQGGMGALGFLPVFLTDAHGQRSFWGFTNVVIRLPQALGPAQFEQLVNQGYNYALWRVDPTTQQRQVIAQSATEPVDAVDFVLDVPNAKWTLSVSPAKAWRHPAGLTVRLVLGLLISALLALLVWQALTNRQRVIQMLQSDLGDQARRVDTLNRHLQATLDTLRRCAVACTLIAHTTLPNAIATLGFVQADPLRAPYRL